MTCFSNKSKRSNLETGSTKNIYTYPANGYTTVGITYSITLLTFLTFLLLRMEV